MSYFDDMTTDEIGTRLGRALRDRDERQPAASMLHLPGVYKGARRRRQRTGRAAVGVLCVALAGLAGIALSARDQQPAPTNDTLNTRPMMLPAYAMLTDAADPSGLRAPASMYAARGGNPYGAPIPAIDVWRRSITATLVIRTVDNDSAPNPPDAATATTEAAATAVGDPGRPWAQRAGATDLTVRGVPGAVEQLAPDQFAVWITQGSPDRYTLVIGRGMTQSDVLTEVEALVDVDGILEPPAGFTAVERAPAQPASTLAGAYAQIGYDFDTGPWAATYEMLAERGSIETITTFSVGTVETIGGRTVMVSVQDGRTTASWWDSAGVIVWIAAIGEDIDVAVLVDSVRMVTEAEWQQASTRLSASVAGGMSEVSRAAVDGLTIVRRTGDGDVRGLCLAIDGQPERCAVQNTAGETPEGMSAQIELDGHWIIFGYRATLPDEVVAMDQMTFTDTADASGTCCDVQWTESNDAYWYVVRVSDALDVVTTNLGNIVGGLVGSISRPLTPSPT